MMTSKRARALSLLAQVSVAERRAYAHAQRTGRDAAEGTFLVMLWIKRSRP